MKIKLSFLALVFTLPICLLAMACSNPEQNPVEKQSGDASILSQVTLPEFRVVGERGSDTPIKTQIEQHIVVSGEITEENLRALLQKQHTEISNLRGFKHHDAPTNIYIYVYDKLDKATLDIRDTVIVKLDQGLWIAMSEMSYGDTEPKLTVRSDLIARQDQEPQEKFALTEVERQEAYQDEALKFVNPTHGAAKIKGKMSTYYYFKTKITADRKSDLSFKENDCLLFDKQGKSYTKCWINVAGWSAGLSVSQRAPIMMKTLSVELSGGESSASHKWNTSMIDGPKGALEFSIPEGGFVEMYFLWEVPRDFSATRVKIGDQLEIAF